MIIKSMSRKTPSFDQLVAYSCAPKGARIAILHNFPASADTPVKIIQEFTKNHALLPHRANGNALYHEIIALPPNMEIAVKEQAAALGAIATRYLEKRAPSQLAFGVIHTDTAHVHMHLMISSNAVLSRRRVWLKKSAFADIQREIEAYKLKRFPELGDRKYFDKSRQGIRRTINEQTASLRSDEPNHKEELAAMLAATLHEACSRDVLDKALADLGLTLYQRGRSVGVQTGGGRRYRLTTLGLAEQYTEAATRFDLAESRLASLHRNLIRQAPEHDRES